MRLQITSLSRCETKQLGFFPFCLLIYSIVDGKNSWDLRIDRTMGGLFILCITLALESNDNIERHGCCEAIA